MGSGIQDRIEHDHGLPGDRMPANYDPNKFFEGYYGKIMPMDKRENKVDNVNHPKHYQLLPGVEVIDVRKAILDKVNKDQWTFEQVDLWSRSWEYLTRMFEKNGIEDAKKAKWYLDRLVKTFEGNKK